MANRKALVAGGLGIVGRALVQHLDTLDDWDIVALSRRAPDFDTRARFISVDLTDRAACVAALADLGDVTHIFFAAVGSAFYAEGAPQSPAEETALNLDMVRNLVEVVAPQASGLEHVQLIHGTKWYGNNFGPFKTPAQETDPRVMPPLFYYAQYDWLKSYQQDKGWSYSNLIPHGIYGFAVKSPYNHLMVLALYACISKELGLPLRWAGRPGPAHSPPSISGPRPPTSPRAWPGPRRRRRAPTRHSTSPTATTIAGAISGHESRSSSTWNPDPCRPSAWPR